MEVNEEERKLVRGFAFLSEKPMIYVENIGEDQLDRLRNPDAHGTLPANTEQTIICGKLEAEMAELPPEELKTFLVGLRTSRIRNRTAYPHDVSPPRIDFFFYRRRRRVPRMDDHARNERTERRRRDSYRSCRSFHPRGSLPLRRFRKAWKHAGIKGERTASAGRQRISRSRMETL